MLKPFIGIQALLIGWIICGPAEAAELDFRPVVRQQAQQAYVCPSQVVYVRHRELWMGYRSGYDPRTHEQLRFFQRGMKTYARYLKPEPC